MNVQPHLTAPMAGGEPPNATRLRGPWRRAGRVGWGCLVVLTMTVVVGSFPVYLTQLRTPCAGPPCFSLQLSPRQVEMLTSVGWAPDTYALVFVALQLASAVLGWVLSTLLVWRRPDDRMALL